MPLPHLQGVVRTTDSAITHVHGLPQTAPPTPAWEELTTNNYKIPTTNNVANDTQGKTPATATVLNVLIASPSDVSAERDTVEKVIHEWNINHRKSTGIMLEPVRWETHSYPAMGERPQGILNKQIVKDADLLIGIFGTRMGTPTGSAPSGTSEEIEEIRKTGRHVALYFSDAPVPRDADRAQLDALEVYRRSLGQQGLYSTFTSVEELHRKVTHDLPKIVNDVVEKLRNNQTVAPVPKQESIDPQPAKRVQHVNRGRAVQLRDDIELSPKEMELLWEAARSSNGEIYHSSTLDGEGIRANGRHFLNGADARTRSEWLSAVGLRIKPHPRPSRFNHLARLQRHKGEVEHP